MWVSTESVAGEAAWPWKAAAAVAGGCWVGLGLQGRHRLLGWLRSGRTGWRWASLQAG